MSGFSLLTDGNGDISFKVPTASVTLHVSSCRSAGMSRGQDEVLALTTQLAHHYCRQKCLKQRQKMYTGPYGLLIVICYGVYTCVCVLWTTLCPESRICQLEEELHL